MQKRIEQYLNRATRGLWGKKRQDVKTELHSHIYERMHYHMAFGKSEEAALGLALHALGKPAEVSRGLFKLHALPALGKMLLVTGLLSTVLVTQAQNVFQLNVNTRTNICEPQDRYCFPGPQNYIKVSELIDIFKAQNLKAHFDQKTHNLLLDNQQLHVKEHALVEEDNEFYLSVSNLLLMLYINQQASISGMINPTIHFKTAKVQLDQEGVDFNAQEFYQGMLSYHMPKFTKKSFITYIKPEYADFIPITIQVPEAKDGEVYALIQPVVRPTTDSNNQPMDAVAVEFAQSKEGKIDLYASSTTLKFSGIDKVDTGYVLLKLSGNPQEPFYQEVFPKEQDILK